MLHCPHGAGESSTATACSHDLLGDRTHHMMLACTLEVSTGTTACCALDLRACAPTIGSYRQRQIGPSVLAVRQVQMRSSTRLTSTPLLTHSIKHPAFPWQAIAIPSLARRSSSGLLHHSEAVSAASLNDRNSDQILRQVPPQFASSKQSEAALRVAQTARCIASL